jgi:single-strand DNA-binding protein
MKTLKNTIHLIGRLGQDPEVHTVETGKKVARLSLATNDNYTGKEDKKVVPTQWHTLIVWGNLATVCEKYLKKGREIAVEGKLTYNNWEDRNGIKHHSTEIQVNELSFIGNQHEFMSTVAAISAK